MNVREVAKRENSRLHEEWEVDYVTGEEVTREKIRRMKVGDRIDSDHHPLEVWIEEKRGRRGGRRKERGKVWKGIWDREGREAFRGKVGEELKERKKERRKREGKRWRV